MKPWKSSFLGGLVLFIQTALGCAQNITVVDMLEPLYNLEEAVETSETVILFGPRGGSASAAILLDAPAEISVSDLQGPGQVIGQEALSVSWVHKPLLNKGLEESHERELGFASSWAVQYTNTPYYDILASSMDSSQQKQMVWITVDIPPSASEGTYKGVLRAGKSSVPVEMEVLKFTCPPPREWRHHRHFDVSLEILALRYGLSLWSSEHWEKIRQTMALLAKTGNDTLHLTLFAGNNYLGTREPLIRLKTDSDGNVSTDLSIVRPYLEMHREWIGEPDSLVLDLWDPAFAPNRRNPQATPKTADALFTRDEGSPQLVPIPLPPQEEGIAIYKSIIDSIHALVDDLSWNRSILKIGYASDIRPDNSIVAFFQEIAPDIPWAVFTHGRGDARPSPGAPFLLGRMPVGQYMHVYVTELPIKDIASPPEATQVIRGGWNLEHEILTSARLWLYDYVPPMQYLGYANHVVGARGDTLPARGFAHIGFNFWELPDGQGPRDQRGKSSQWANMFRTSVNSLVWPGEDTILPTIRYELFRQGQQELEARVTIEQALLDGSLSEALSNRCTQTLHEFYKTRSRDGKLYSSDETYYQMDYRACLFGKDESGGLRRRLFELAGQVQSETRSQTPGSGVSESIEQP